MITVNFEFNDKKFPLEVNPRESIATALGKLFDQYKDELLSSSFVYKCLSCNGSFISNIFKTLKEEGISNGSKVVLISGETTQSMITTTTTTTKPNEYDRIFNSTASNPRSFKVKRYNKGIYFGDVQSGLRNGVGTHLFDNGGLYKGSWSNDKQKGKGTSIFQNGNVYVGEMENNKLNGYGIYIYNNDNKCDIYLGEFRDNKRTGYGKYIWSNGYMYEGEWDNDKQHGDGILVSEQLKVKRGRWENDNYVGN